MIYYGKLVIPPRQKRYALYVTYYLSVMQVTRAHSIMSVSDV